MNVWWVLSLFHSVRITKVFHSRPSVHITREANGQTNIVRCLFANPTDNLSKAGWSWGWVSAIDSNGRTIWIADAHRGDGKRFVVRADEKLTAFLELEAAICADSQ